MVVPVNTLPELLTRILGALSGDERKRVNVWAVQNTLVAHSMMVNRYVGDLGPLEMVRDVVATVSGNPEFFAPFVHMPPASGKVEEHVEKYDSFVESKTETAKREGYRARGAYVRTWTAGEVAAFVTANALYSGSSANRKIAAYITSHGTGTETGGTEMGPSHVASFKIAFRRSPSRFTSIAAAVTSGLLPPSHVVHPSPANDHHVYEK